MNTVLHAAVMPAAVGTAEDASSFFSSGLGLLIQNVSIGFGILLGVFVVINFIKNLTSAKASTGKAVGGLLVGIIGVVILFNLNLPFGLIAGFSNVVSAFIETVSGWLG